MVEDEGLGSWVVEGDGDGVLGCVMVLVVAVVLVIDE